MMHAPGAFGLVLAILWGGLCSADQRALGARQLHQPLVAASVAGLLLGDPLRGALAGIWLQLVWPAPLPVGGALLPDTGTAAVAAVIVASLLPGDLGWTVALVAGLAVGALGVAWEAQLREANGRREERALRAGGGWGGAIAGGVAGAFTRGVAGATLALALGWILRRAVPWPAATHPWLVWSLLAAASTLAVASLLPRVRTELAGRGSYLWLGAGLAIGATGRILLDGILR
ncbi:MAG: PTS sugar transporter subunit IIC [Candidatus Eisenbacteria bacterium]